MLNEILNDAEQMQTEIPNDEAIKCVSELCKQMSKLEEDIAAYENMVKAKKEQLLRVSTQLLPELLRQFGMAEITLTDGRKVSMKKQYFASITKEKQEEAYEWLRENNCGYIIKEKLEIPFDKKKKGDDNSEYQSLIDLLAEHNISFNEKGEIPWQTLRAFVKEKMEDSESTDEFPKELFGVFMQDVVTIK